MAGTSRPEPISKRRQRIAGLASMEPRMRLTTLAHHIDRNWLLEAYRLTRKGGATGIDGVTAEQYAESLEENLGVLEDAVKAGRYRAPPVLRAHVPKADGKLRPLGIPTFEDKVLQRAFVMLLEPVFEQDFLDCSYGFRPGRSAHDALVALREGLRKMGGGWVLDVDLRSFFDTVDHATLRELVSERVHDGVVLRTIGKWLNAGVMEGASVHRGSAGTPQGGVISPLLANLYLHHAVDLWFAEQVKPRMRGRAFMVRYADDFVMAFQHEDDARRVLAVLPKRLDRFKLSLNTEKTRLVFFGRPRPDGDQPGTFSFLGFDLYWGKSRRGNTVLRWKTSKKSLNRSLLAIHAWCKRYRHLPIARQHELLSQKLRGHYNYFGLTMNMRSLARYFWRVVRIWRHWLDRRSQRRRMDWQRFRNLLGRYPLPRPMVVHSVYKRV